MNPIAKPGILDIPLYVAGSAKSAVANTRKLSANESAMGASPLAIAAYISASDQIFRYPSSDYLELKQAIAASIGGNVDKIMCGCGSDELIHMLVHGFAGPGDEVIQSKYGFLVYEIATMQHGASIIKTNKDSLKVDVDSILACVNSRTKIIFIDNPNNPTGTFISFSEIERLHKNIPEHVLLVIDEAYGEFAEGTGYQTAISLAETHENVVILRTFSKIYGLAGLRMGWSYSCPAIVAILNRLRHAFHISLPAQAACIAALTDTDFINKAKANNKKWREWLTDSLSALGLKVVPSATNFILVHFNSVQMAQAVDDYLLSQGIAVRRVNSYKLPEYLRITIGSGDDCQIVAEKIEYFLRVNDK